jgi:hypothetical protein
LIKDKIPVDQKYYKTFFIVQTVAQYSVTIDAAAASGLSDTSISNVSVRYGLIIDVGITTFVP